MSRSRLSKREHSLFNARLKTHVCVSLSRVHVNKKNRKQRHIPTPSGDTKSRRFTVSRTRSPLRLTNTVLWLVSCTPVLSTHCECWDHPILSRMSRHNLTHNPIPRGWFGSATSTTSPSFRFFLFSLHFFLSVRLGTYSLAKRFQKKFTSAWD